MLYAIAYHVVGPLFNLLYRIEIRGRENLDQDARIFAANHKSYLDPVLVGYAAYPRRLHYMAKVELWKIPVLAQLITALNAFPVAREGFDRKALVKALEILRNGGSMLMFPEGTRIRRAGLGEAKAGVAAIAVKAGVRIVPVGIDGADRVFPDGKKIPRFPKITVSFGKPIDPTPYGKDYDRTIEVVMEEIGKLTGMERSEIDEGAIV